MNSIHELPAERQIEGRVRGIGRAVHEQQRAFGRERREVGRPLVADVDVDARLGGDHMICSRKIGHRNRHCRASLHICDGNAQCAPTRQQTFIVACQLDCLSPRAKKLDGRQMDRIERANVRGNGSNARFRTGGANSSSVKRSISILASSPCERLSSRALRRFQISYSRSRLANIGSRQNLSDGRRSSDRS
jgi:hypothetical protein